MMSQRYSKGDRHSSHGIIINIKEAQLGNSAERMAKGANSDAFVLTSIYPQTICVYLYPKFQKIRSCTSMGYRYPYRNQFFDTDVASKYHLQSTVLRYIR